ncbi:hypothetical protein [Mycobacterium aquaticum]|uniref:Uncharacterized protein n=1 Tax=Mycobacterium aquaticum TaxID=1927124 RepID=A0A1X0ABG0_9MYCO|nr:hypothetical protein [Mycobacterium aquaticum]ORA27374.1 hypothetical protein BST13_30410 [Mycobacterium aquaticum]
MKRISKLSSVAAGMAALALTTLTAAPANADPMLCYADSANYNPGLCEQWRRSDHGGRIALQRTPAFAEPGSPMYERTQGRSGGGGIGGWLSEHAGLVVLVIAGLIAWVVIAKVRRAKAEEEKKQTARESAALARGRRIAEEWHAEQVAKAHADAAAMVPDRSVYDPHEIGLAPPPPPPAVMPERPPMKNADLRRYAAFGAVVPREPGTAFAQAVTRSGDDAPIRSAWFQACQLAGVGETDPETGEFTPAAAVVRVDPVRDGDVEISVNTRDYTIGEQQLNRVLRHLERTARVATASPFERNPAKDWFVTRLSMEQRSPQQQAPAPAQPLPAPTQPAAAQVDPDDPWS